MQLFSLRRLLWAGPLVTLAAALANLLFYFISRALGGQYLFPVDAAGTRLEPMPAWMPVLPTLALGLVASLFFALLVRFARRPVTIFLSVAATALLVSFGAPAGLPGGTPLSTRFLLAGMNLLTALVLSAGILALSRNRQP
jgi:hypothetical protein